MTAHEGAHNAETVCPCGGVLRPWVQDQAGRWTWCRRCGQYVAEYWKWAARKERRAWEAGIKAGINLEQGRHHDVFHGEEPDDTPQQRDGEVTQ